MSKHQFPIALLITLSLISSFDSIQSATFTLTNQCIYPVWAGLLSGAGTPPLPTTGFPLQPSQSNSIPIPSSWFHRIWGRTLCSTDSTGRFTCVNGGGAAPPAILAEFTLNGANGMDFYNVSLVDGGNLPMTVVPQGESSGNCNVTGCVADLRQSELRLTMTTGDESVACRSACEAFGGCSIRQVSEFGDGGVDCGGNPKVTKKKGMK
ncbi:hypothetical protein R6Q59_036510 [Mikania micrantha]|uniref:Thaumatin-like protein n=1 Tax=Mikania micrantha TaxID=192012 RepID=A0A5N6LIK3_9ASTR|nr:hypothetical protein E3N88_42167 [Mikania micrantha]